jgi:hypothetical protein
MKNIVGLVRASPGKEFLVRGAYDVDVEALDA